MASMPDTQSAARVASPPSHVGKPSSGLELKEGQKAEKPPVGDQLVPPIELLPSIAQFQSTTPALKVPSPATASSDLPLGGCAKGSARLMENPAKLVNQRIVLQSQHPLANRAGMVTQYDSEKGLHTVTFGDHSEALVKLSDCRWTSDTTMKSHQQENNNSNNTGDQMDIEEEGRSKRKRPLHRMLRSTCKNKGVIPAKGRRPYRKGGCKTGKFYGPEKLVGLRVHMWSSQDMVYYAAGVTDYNMYDGKHTILYLDGRTETLDMADATWRLSTSEFDSIYPEDFHIKSNSQPQSSDVRETRDLRETRRRRGNSGQTLAATPNKAAEGLLALASGGGASPGGASPGASGGGGGGGGGGAAAGGTPKPNSPTPPAGPAKDDRSASGTGQRQSAGGPGRSLASGGGAGEESKAGDDGQKQPAISGDGVKKLVASSLEFQVHKVENPDKGYHVLCSVPAGTRISDVHVTCGNACIIIEHGKNDSQGKAPEGESDPSGCSRLVILLPEPIRPSSASAKLTQGGKLAVFTALATA